MIIGPMKAGTTWVDRYLRARGDVRLPYQVKETFFFDRYYDRGQSWYFNHFARWKGEDAKQTVEVAPSLFHNAEAPNRVRDVLGQVPLVVTIRDPVLRSWSHYLHMCRRGYTDKPLRDAVGEFPEILEASLYDEMLARWRSALPASPVAVLQLEELIDDPDAYVRKLCDALGLPFIPVQEELRGREYSAAQPTSFWLARFGRTISRSLQSAELYSVLNLVKAMGLRRLFYGDGNNGRTAPAPTQSELEWLRRALEHN